MPASFRIYYTWDSRTITEAFSAAALANAVDHAEARSATLPPGSYFEIWQDANLVSTSADILSGVPARPGIIAERLG